MREIVRIRCPSNTPPIHFASNCMFEPHIASDVRLGDKSRTSRAVRRGGVLMLDSKLNLVYVYVCGWMGVSRLVQSSWFMGSHHLETYDTQHVRTRMSTHPPNTYDTTTQQHIYDTNLNTQTRRIVRFCLTHTSSRSTHRRHGGVMDAI